MLLASRIEIAIVQPSTSPWSSLIHMVPKPGTGKYRICGDYRTLNACTVIDRYPIPHINSVGNKLHGKIYYSKLDLVNAYNHLRVKPSDVNKTAVTTPFGKFDFGLKNAAASFQRHMDQMFMNTDFTFTYLDDILVFSNNKQTNIYKQYPLI